MPGAVAVTRKGHTAAELRRAAARTKDADAAWRMLARQGGIRHWHTIGAADVLTLDEARKRALKILVALGDGEDPAAQKASKRAASALTFSRVMEDYLEARRPGLAPLAAAADRGFWPVRPASNANYDDVPISSGPRAPQDDRRPSSWPWTVVPAVVPVIFEQKLTAAEVARRLKGKRSGKFWICCCPAHDDRSPSLSIWDGDVAVRRRSKQRLVWLIVLALLAALIWLFFDVAEAPGHGS
jgi:hypothetical protein